MHIAENPNNRLSSKDKYLDFINNNNGHYIKNNIDINSQNVENFLSSLSFEDKNKISTLDLNIYYYLMNKMYKKYIDKKDKIIQIIDTCISLDKRHKAFERLDN